MWSTTKCLELLDAPDLARGQVRLGALGIRLEVHLNVVLS